MELNGVQYDAILVRGTPRFRANKRLVAVEAVPEEVKAALTAQLLAKEEQKKVDALVAAATQETTDVSVATEPIAIAPQTVVVPVTQPEPAAEKTGAEQGAGFSDFELRLINEVEELKRQLVELAPSVPTNSLETASLGNLAQEMYRRFGVYTAFVGDYPKAEDVHPFTGANMTRYDVGLAYQGFTRAKATGVLDVDLAERRQVLADVETARENHMAEIDNRRADPTYGQEKHQSFMERTSVRGQNRTATRTVARPNDPISEDATVEPNLRGQTIRPDW